MKGAPAWRGDWYTRIKERVRERGFHSATEFADSQPTASLVTLARQLGKNKDVAGAQLEKVLLHEAEEAGTMEYCSRSLLVRSLWQKLPEGWRKSMNEDYTFRRAGAFANWSAALGRRYKPTVYDIWDELAAQPVPEDWLPSGPDDPILVEIFQKHWREPEQKDSSGK